MLPSWDQLFSQWSGLESARRRQDAELLLRDARKRVSANTDADWEWLEQGLADPVRKHFVGRVFRWQPVPKRLFAAFMRAAVVDVNYSRNRDFLKPCIESFGRDAVQRHLDELRASGVATPEMYAGAMYWMGEAVPFRRHNPPGER